MAEIKILDELLASKIAAGEVIERPASVVKELMENSIDAGASSVSVYLAEGGRRLIRVVDDGEGISREDAPLAFVRHATSKISTEEDLEAIRTMGFRGEALASVGAVAKVVLRTRRHGGLTGTSVTVEGGGKPVVADDGCPEGTSIEVKDLFYNTPARLKFMKSAPAEFGRASDVFKAIALINPGVRFRLSHGSSKPLETAAGSLKARIADLLGGDIAGELTEISAPNVSGYIGRPSLSCGSAKGLHVYVNGRPVRDKSINRAILDGYGTLLDGPRYPFAVIALSVPPGDVDINIHPAKSEVRFRSPRAVYEAVRAAVRLALARPAGQTGAAGPQADTVGRGAGGFEPYAQPSAGPSFLSSEQTEPYAASGRGLRFIEPGPDVKNPEFLSMTAVGQLWGEFLIAEGDGEFYIIDAHGAAERAAFERLRDACRDGARVKSQMLLLPERVETTPEEKEGITGSMDYLERMGFEIMPFGPSARAGGETFMIKAVPEILSSRSCASLIKELAGGLASCGGSAAVDERIEAALMRIACHSVIRGARRLTQEEGNALIRSLARIDFAGHCPHGRPVVKRFTRAEIEAMFGR